MIVIKLVDWRCPDERGMDGGGGGCCTPVCHYHNYLVVTVTSICSHVMPLRLLVVYLPDQDVETLQW